MFIVVLSITIMMLLACNSSDTTSSQWTHPEWTHLSSSNGHLPLPGASKQQTASLVLDVDKDAKIDFIIGSREQGPAVLWYRRGSFGWTRYVIDSDFLPVEAGGAYHDIDKDGDFDIVLGGDSHSNTVWWWENPYPNYDPSVSWKRRLVKNSGAKKHHDLLFGDFDGDEKAELVFWNQGANKLFIAEIPIDPKNTDEPWPYIEVFTTTSTSEGLTKADIDDDGKIDIVGGGRWFKHNKGVSYLPKVIDDGQSFTRVAAGQLKQGSWAEAVFVAGDGVGRLKWYEWTEDKGWMGHGLLESDVDHGHTLALSDFNGDGNLDIFCAEMRLNSNNPNAKMWIFLGDGNGNFEKTVVATGFGNHESKVADLDGDGDLDILGKPYNWDTPRVDVWLHGNTGLRLDTWERHVVDPEKPWRTTFITSADIDKDSYKDIVTGGWWYKNSGTLGGRWIRNTIGVPLHNMSTVFDFDHDGDSDVLGTAWQGTGANSSFSWARNDGSGSFTILNNVAAGEGDFLQGVVVENFQGPTEIALSWHASEEGLQMLTVPLDPSKDRWTWRKASNISQDEALSAGDIDSDGAIDLLLGTQWLQNSGVSWDSHSLDNTGDSPDRNVLADMNQDGKLDAVVGFEAISQDGKLAWYEQGISSTSSWTEHVVAMIVGPMSLDVADMNGDGDLDIIVGEHNMADSNSAKLYIFENADGYGNSWTEHVVYTGDEHHDGAHVVDIDNDSDLDILSIGWGHNQVILHENKAIEERR